MNTGWPAVPLTVQLHLFWTRSMKIKRQLDNPIVHITVRYTHAHPFSGPFSGTTRVSQYQKGTIWISLKQEKVSGSGMSWAICKSAPCSRLITMPVPHHSVFYRLDALPAAQPTASKHWRKYHCTLIVYLSTSVDRNLLCKIGDTCTVHILILFSKSISE